MNNTNGKIAEQSKKKIADALIRVMDVAVVWGGERSEVDHVRSEVEVVAQRGEVGIFVSPHFETQGQHVARAGGDGVNHGIAVGCLARDAVGVGDVAVSTMVAG